MQLEQRKVTRLVIGSMQVEPHLTGNTVYRVWFLVYGLLKVMVFCFQVERKNLGKRFLLMIVLMSMQEEDKRTLSRTEGRKENGNTLHLMIHPALILIPIPIHIPLIVIQLQIPRYQIQAPPVMEGVERGRDQ